MVDILEISKKLNYPTPLPIAKEIFEWTEGNKEKIDEVLKRINDDEPWEYIRGWGEFLGRKFFLNKSTLIPRQETEMLVNIAVKYIKNEKDLQIFDIGTGSGCIAISLEKILNREIIATDISKDALYIAKKNAKFNNAKKIKFLKANLLDFKFDMNKPTVIIANLPYVKSKNIEKLNNSVRNFEPISALDGGVNGLKYYIDVVKEFKKINLKLALFEIDENMVIEIKEEFSQYNLEFLKDQFENIRFLKINPSHLK